MKELEFNYDSWNAKLYRWFFDFRYMPNLCPYFWQSVFMWIVMPIYCAFALPFFPWKSFTKNSAWRCRAEEMSIGLFIYGLAFMAVCILYFLYAFIFIDGLNLLSHYHPGFLDFMFGLGFIGFIVLVITLITMAVLKISDVRNQKLIDAYIKETGKYPCYDEHKKKPNKKSFLLIEGIKAIYNKACPKINWKGQPEKPNYDY